MKRLLPLLVAAAGMSLAGVAHAAAEAPVSGNWQKHQDMFAYLGFTSHYSCEGLREKLTLLLTLAGARPGFKVDSTCAQPSGVPDRIATARLTFWTLAPEGAPPPAATGKSGDKTPAAAEPGVGAWRAVELRAGSPRELQGGDCELVDQFAHEILPMFTTRELTSRMNCVPHQENPQGILLKFEVLGAVPEPKHPVASAR